MKARYYFLIAFLLMLFIVVMNTIPKGYVFAFGDFNQIINLEQNYSRFFYTWTENSNLFGAYSPLFVFYLFYLILLPIDLLFKSPPLLMQIVWFFTLFGSFVSFYYCLNILNLNDNKKLQFLLSLIYSVNIYTLNSFMHLFFNRIHSIIYIIFPIFFAICYTIISDKTKKNIKLLTIYSILLFLFIFSFGNPAFFLMYFFLLAIMAIYLASIKKINVLSLVLFVVVSLLITLPFILPTLFNFSTGLEELSKARVKT